MSLEQINHKNTYGYTPLDYAYSFNKSPIRNDLIQLIREYKGKANCHDINGNRVGKGKDDLTDDDDDDSVKSSLPFPTRLPFIS
jgi:hypothetical protein